SNQDDLARQRYRGLGLSEKRKIHFFDNFEYGVRLEGRTIETLLNSCQKLRIKSFRFQAQKFFIARIVHAHNLPPSQWLSSASITGVAFGKMVRALVLRAPGCDAGLRRGIVRSRATVASSPDIQPR